MPAVTQDIHNILGSGVTLLSVPASPGFRSQEWKLANPTSVNISPYTGQQQVQQWLGAESWQVTCSLPPMTLAEAALWRAFLLRCRGRTNTFQLCDQLNATPCGNSEGSNPATAASASGVNQPGLQALTTYGWTPGTYGVIAAGDYLQVGYRLYQCLVGQDADNSGSCLIPVWPSLREAPPAGTPVQLVQPCGIFRLAEDTVSWTHDYSRRPSLSFTAIEFR